MWRRRCRKPGCLGNGAGSPRALPCRCPSPPVPSPAPSPCRTPSPTGTGAWAQVPPTTPGLICGRHAQQSPPAAGQGSPRQHGGDVSPPSQSPCTARGAEHRAAALFLVSLALVEARGPDAVCGTAPRGAAKLFQQHVCSGGLSLSPLLAMSLLVPPSQLGLASSIPGHGCEAAAHTHTHTLSPLLLFVSQG